MRGTQTLRILAGGVLTLLAVFALPGGCADGLTVSDVLDTVTAGATAEAAKQDEATASSEQDAVTTDVQTGEDSAVTTASADDGSALPADRPPGPDMGGPGPRLTEEQRVALAALQDALDAGEITQEEFCQQVHDLLGDPPCGPPLPPIDLTDEQITQAEAIFQAAHDQIVALHETARADVLAQLTEEQQQTLADLAEPNAPPEGQGPPFIALCPPPENAACARPVRVPLPPCRPMDAPPGEPAPDASAPAGLPPGPPMGDGPHGPQPPCLNDETIAALELSAEQVTAITEIHDTLRTSGQAVRDDAQAAFRAILTEEQLQELDQLPPRPPHHGPCPPM
jgi:Spy/CpxP family protein refolding chaperone